MRTQNKNVANQKAQKGETLRGIISNRYDTTISNICQVPSTIPQGNHFLMLYIEVNMLKRIALKANWNKWLAATYRCYC
jgi:beta-mannanase